MSNCLICKEPIPLDHAAMLAKNGSRVCCPCEPRLRETVRVLKLRLDPGGPWMGFVADEPLGGLLEELKMLASEGEAGDEAIIKTEDLTRAEVLAWPEFPGW